MHRQQLRRCVACMPTLAVCTAEDMHAAYSRGIARLPPRAQPTAPFRVQWDRKRSALV
jgi:hypothetical protein